MNKRFSAKFVLIMLVTFSMFITVIIGYRFFYIATNNVLDGVDIKALKEKRNTLISTLQAKRGMICDAQENTLAMSVNTYDISLNLSPLYSDETHIKHVVNKEETAHILATELNAPYEYIISQLNPAKISYTLDEYLNTLKPLEKVEALMSGTNVLEKLSVEITQVELGKYGKNLNEIQKKKIEDLNISGLSFTETQNRFYKNGAYASHIIGYAQNKDGILEGQMGLEASLEQRLKGIDGYSKVQVDSQGNKIPNTPEETVYPKNGVDVCLTLDRKIQESIEDSLKDFQNKFSPSWALGVVMNAKTGEILGASQSPSFDPNVKEISNYINLLVEQPYEPGSVMKPFTYAAAINEGVYKGDTVYKTGEMQVGPDKIVDYEHAAGWGSELTYDEGLIRSSNVAIAHILRDNLSEPAFKKYLSKFGFGQTTDSSMMGEKPGSIKYNTELEQYNAGFGQGILVTPMQILQAYTAFANNGDVIKPYIVSSYKDVSNKRTIFQNERTVVAKNVINNDTISKVKDLMKGVVSSELHVSRPYDTPGVDLIGKTGTAQYIDPETNKYTTQNQRAIVSFVGMYPKEDPQFIIYVAAKDVNAGYTSGALSQLAKGLIHGTNDYNLIKNSGDFVQSNGEFRDFKNTNTADVNKYLHETAQNYIIIGDGEKILDYAPKNIEISKDDLLVLYSGGNATMPDLSNKSKKDVLKFAEALNIKVTFEGNGYVKSQSLEVGATINVNEINFILGP